MQTQNCQPSSKNRGAVARPLSSRQEIELAALGLRVEDFHCFTSHFVGHLFDYIQRRLQDTTWRLIKRYPLTNATLLRHLQGERWVGTGCRWDPDLGTKGRHATQYAVIDIDFHGDWDGLGRVSGTGAGQDPSWVDMMRRFDGVVRALGYPSVVFRSSDSGGLHCYYLFTHSVELHALRAPDGLGGALPRLLAAHGFAETPGHIEVYPRGQYERRGPQNRIRLPFGRGSVALDPYALDRFSLRGPLADLQVVTDRLQRGTMPLVDPDYWMEESRELPAPGKGQKGAQVKRRQSHRSIPAATETNQLELRHVGLTGAGQFNEAIWTLAAELRGGGASCDEAKARVCAWLDEKHNGCSRTYNSCRDGAQREVEVVVARLYARGGGAGHWGELPGLSSWEATELIRVTNHDYQLADPRTGELVKRFKVQHLGFELLRRSKQWLLREVRWRLARIAGEDAGLIEHNALCDAITPLVQSFWPDCSRPEFIVPLPYTLRAGIKGIGKDSLWSLWRVLGGSGLYRLSRRASADAHRAATYVVSLDFGTLSAQAVELDSLAGALNHLLTSEQIRTQYSQHYAGSIREAPGPRLMTPAGDNRALATIQQLLRSPSSIAALPEAA